MRGLICPVCGGALTKEERRCVCPAGHSFDLARQGYVNLRLSGQSARRRHGDDRAMVRSRTAFLDKGYYRCVLDAVLAEVLTCAADGCTVLDAGCGEGWYTAHVAAALAERVQDPCVIGIDISKDAVAAAGRRGAGLTLAVASSARLPAAAESCDVVLDLFAPLEPAEFARVLKMEGTLIRAIPLQEHLMGLKRAVYDTPRPNDPPVMELDGFALAAVRDVYGTLHLDSSADIQALFMMTPYYYKTGAADQAKLAAVRHLDTELAVRVAAYRKAT